MYQGTEQELRSVLAERVGISPEYHDITGTLHVATDETKHAILEAMGFQVDSSEHIIQELVAWDEAPGGGAACGNAHFETGVRAGAVVAPASTLEGRTTTGCFLAPHRRKGEVIHEEEAGPGLVPQEVRYLAGGRFVRLDLPDASEPGSWLLRIECNHAAAPKSTSRGACA
ncbi:MAG: hypothetical protein U0231_11700 [Nitrospiraceae bacterium]